MLDAAVWLESFFGRLPACDVCAMIPRRSASVSKLVRVSSIGVLDPFGPGLDRADRLACSLCCQQYNFSSRGSSTRNFTCLRGEIEESVVFEEAIGRLQGRPDEVMPRHVVAGFLESDRSICDSGVLGKNGILGFLRVTGRKWERERERERELNGRLN